MSVPSLFVHSDDCVLRDNVRTVDSRLQGRAELEWTTGGELDWQRIEAAFADELRVDYSSLFGGEPEVLTAGELLDRWRGLLPGFDATQHLTGPVLVSIADDATATAHTHVRGYHHIADAQGGPVWQAAVTTSWR